MSNFEQAFDAIVEIEGFFSDDSSDPGGATRFGITEAVARQHGYKGEMKDLPEAFAKNVYRAFYWDLVRGDDLAWPLALLVFDCAVNQGPATAIGLLQRAVLVAQDGIFGPTTLAAVQRANQKALCGTFMTERALRYVTTPGYPRYARGWFDRLFSLAFEYGVAHSATPGETK